MSGRDALQKLDRPVPQPDIFRWLRCQYETELSWIRQIRQKLQEMEAAHQRAKLLTIITSGDSSPRLPIQKPDGVKSPYRDSRLTASAAHVRWLCFLSRWDLRVPVRVSPGVAQYETELSLIRQIRQELQQMEFSHQWAKL